MAIFPVTNPRILLKNLAPDNKWFIFWSSLESAPRWIITVTPHLNIQRPQHPSPRLRRGGADYQNLLSLCRSSRPAGHSALAKLALVNARSLANKIFILNDFFTTRNYFLLVTETWLNLGELSPFSDLLLVQSVKGPTHEHGHTLDLTLLLIDTEIFKT